MAGIICQHDEFQTFEKLAARWNVEERLRQQVPVPWSRALSGDLGGHSGPGKSISLASMFRPSYAEDYERDLVAALNGIWSEIESHSYSKALVEQPDYRNASKGFERKIKRITDEKARVRKRIEFRYLTGFHIYILGRLPRPVRLVPDKDTAERVSKRIVALLEDMERPDEFAEWADYRVKSMLRELRDKMEASKLIQRVPNSLSPENYFVFQLAQRFADSFDEPMPAVLGDLCRVIGANPDESTINRWVTQAIEHRRRPEGQKTPAR